MPVGRVSSTWKRTPCLWGGISFQQLINGKEAIVSCHCAAGACQAQIGWVQGKRKSVQLPDREELSQWDIFCFGTVCFTSFYTSVLPVVEIKCHFKPIHSNKESRQQSFIILSSKEPIYPEQLKPTHIFGCKRMIWDVMNKDVCSKASKRNCFFLVFLWDRRRFSLL